MLACFSGVTAAQHAIQRVSHPVIRLKPLSFAVAAAMRALPPPLKAKRDASVARRLIAGALGTRLPRTRRRDDGTAAAAPTSGRRASSRRVRGRGANQGRARALASDDAW